MDGNASIHRAQPAAPSRSSSSSSLPTSASSSGTQLVSPSYLFSEPILTLLPDSKRPYATPRHQHLDNTGRASECSSLAALLLGTLPHIRSTNSILENTCVTLLHGRRTSPKIFGNS